MTLWNDPNFIRKVGHRKRVFSFWGIQVISEQYFEQEQSMPVSMP